MTFPTSDWPTIVDPLLDRVDGVSVVTSTDFEYQDDQIRTIQTWLGTAGGFIGEGVSGAGASGIVSPSATGGVAFTIAARQNFTSGTLLSVGDDYNGTYTEWFSVEYNGQAYVDGNRVLTEDSAEFASITEKATPVIADILLIEDSEDSNSKKRVQVGNLPGGSGTDADAIHDNVPGEIVAVTPKLAPTTSDYLLIEDAADLNNKKSITIGDLPGGSDGRGFAIVIGNSIAGDTSDICDYLDVGDCAQLKAGIEAAAGKPVYIRPGIYDWNNGASASNQVTVPIGTRVVGAGMDSVIIRLLDGATEAEAFVLQGGGSVLEEFTVSVPTPTSFVESFSSQGYINNAGTTGTSGLVRVRVSFEDSGWSTLADLNYVSMLYVIYSGSNGDRFFVDRCEFIDVPNYASTPPLQQVRLQIMACFGQLDTVEVRGTFSWGGDLAYELGGDEISFTDNIVASIGYQYALRLIGNGLSPGTERPARIVNNDIVMLYDPAENNQYGILCLTDVGLVVAANNITLEGGTHVGTIAIDIGNSDKATIVANRFDAESGWQNSVNCGSGSTGTIVANHFGSATVAGTTTGWNIGLNYPITALTDDDAIHDNVDGEINAITEKASPVGADIIVIEDSAASYAKKKVQITNLPGGSGTDADAIHDNVAAEISAITAKATPTTSDYLVIEDAAAADAKKSITIGDLPAAAPAAHDLSGSLHNSTTLANLNAKVSDATLDDSSSTRPPTAHDLAGSDHNSATLAQLNAKVSDATLDDSSSTRDPNAHTLGGSAHSSDTLANLNAKISDATLDDSSSPRTDNDAIHDNVSGEIAAITAKATPTTSDYLVIEDAAATNAKKSITIGDLPAASPASHASTHNAGGGDALAIDAVAGTGSLRTLGTGAQQACAGNDSRLSDNRTDADAIHDNVSGEINAITEKTTPVGADVLVIEDSAATYAKKRVQITNLPGGADADAIHDNVAGEINAITEKTTPADADLLIIEDSADSNNKKKLQIGNLPSGSSTASYGEATSYRELVSNSLDTQGVSSVENDTGEGVFDAGLHQSLLFRATLTASWASTGTLSVKLYDDGPTSAPGTPRLVTTFSKTADGGYEVFEQALTIVSSGASTNEVLGEARVYRVTITVNGTTGDTGYIGSAGFVATGSAETLLADEIQAITMSLNA